MNDLQSPFCATHTYDYACSIRKKKTNENLSSIEGTVYCIQGQWDHLKAGINNNCDHSHCGNFNNNNPSNNGKANADQ